MARSAEAAGGFVERTAGPVSWRSKMRPKFRAVELSAFSMVGWRAGSSVGLASTLDSSHRGP